MNLTAPAAILASNTSNSRQRATYLKINNLSYAETTTDNSEGQAYNRWVFSLASSGSVTGMSTAVAVTSAPKATGSQKQVPPPTVTYLADADGTAWKFKVGTETMVLDRNTTANYLDEKARLVTCVEAESATPSSPMFIYTDEPDIRRK